MPIDIASGVLHLDYQDIWVPGKIDLAWPRQFSTGRLQGSSTPLGPGWWSRYFVALRRTAGLFEFLSPNGSTEAIADPGNAVDGGARARRLEAFLEVFRDAQDYLVQSWDAETGEIWRYRFRPGSAGDWMPLVSLEDVAGNALDLLRDQRGRLVAVRQRLERRALHLGYDDHGRIGSISLGGPSGARHLICRYEHDPAGRLTAAFDALGNAARYEYDDTGRMIREIALDGGVTSFRYDPSGRCVRTSGLDRYDEKTLRYVDAARVTEVTDSHGAVTRYTCRPDGQVLSIADPLGGVTDMEYDEAGRIILERRPSGAATSFAYDDNGNRSQITDARGGVFAVTFNDHHQVTKLVDAAGNAWVRDYDTSRRLVSSVDPTGARWELRYDGVGNPVAVVNPLGAIRTQTYVGGIVTETTDWKGQTTRVISDDFGRVIERVEPLGRRFGFRYDAVGNLVQVALPDGGMVEATYDGGGNLARLTDPKGATTTYRYGPCRRILERTDPNGHRTTYVWDTEPGRPLRVTNPKGEHYDFEYNAVGLVTREVSFDGRQYRYEYTPDGWCSIVINGALETIRIVRDPEGRMVEQHCSDGKVAKYAYDALGNVIEAVNDAVALTVQRDAVGRVVRETQADRWVSSQRDLLGDRLRLETSLGYFATWEHDPNGDPTRIATANNAVTQSQWDAGRNEIFRSLSDRVQLRQSFDVCGRLSTQRVDSVVRAADANHGGWSDRLELVVDRIFGRDASGVPTSIDETWWGATRYTYDAASQLLRTLREVGESETFQYDSTGNITSQTVGENPATDLEYGPGNRLLRKGSARYHYDAQGRLIRKTEESAGGAVVTWQYRWDVLDQLTTFTGPDGEEWHYAYDAFGRRVEKRGPQGGTTFVWDGDVIVHEVQAGKEWSGWLYSGQTSLTPIAKTVGANSFWVISDHLDTPREMVDDVGVVRWRLFGRSYGDGGPSIEDVDNPFRFQGQYRDEESGLHYSRFRYYDPDTGRFIQQDPIALVGSDNLYWYAPNPISWLDPFGLTTASCKSGDRGRAKAVADMKKAGFKIVGEEVTMIVGGARIRADFVAEKNGRLYVFEVKNGTGGLTENQTSSKAFNIGNPANQNGAIQTSGGSDPPGRVKPFTIDTDNAPARLGDRGDTGSATFAVLKYDGTPGSRVD